MSLLLTAAAFHLIMLVDKNRIRVAAREMCQRRPLPFLVELFYSPKRVHTCGKARHMNVMNTAAGYGWPARLLHWLIVVLIVAQFVLANMAESAESRMDMFKLFAQHKSVGITIFALALVRLIWRLANTQPRLPMRTPTWQMHVAKTTHWLLYALIFALPITGVLGSAANNYPVTWFGMFTVPPLIGSNEALADTLHETHEILAAALFCLAMLHILAALKHHFYHKDNVLRRMIRQVS